MTNFYFYSVLSENIYRRKSGLSCTTAKMVRIGGDLVNAQKNNVFYPEFEKKKTTVSQSIVQKNRNLKEEIKKK